jgi:hypothetical protein
MRGVSGKSTSVLPGRMLRRYGLVFCGAVALLPDRSFDARKRKHAGILVPFFGLAEPLAAS